MTQPQESSDLKYFLWSFCGHLAVLLIFTIKIFLFPTERAEYIRSVRVDLIDLPDVNPQEGPKGAPKTIESHQESKPAPPPPSPVVEKEAPTKEKVISLEKSKKQKNKKEESNEQTSALKRIEALEKIKKMKEKSAASTQPEGVQHKGNVLSDGSALTGVDKLQHDKYLEKLDQQIKQNWHLPEWLANKNLAAAVVIKFDESGNLLDKKLVRSSGNPTFDQEAIAAIAASAPFPAPPENLVSYFKVRGIELRFPE